MPSLPRPLLAHRRAHQRFWIWLLASVVPLQAMAVALFAALGPAHIHLAEAALRPTLNDLRRWAPTPPPNTRLLGFLGHRHGATAAQRHHHAFDDRTVVRVADDPAATDEGLNTAASLGSMPALPCTGFAWVSTGRSTRPASRPAWVASHTFSAPPERPPKAG